MMDGWQDISTAPKDVGPDGKRRWIIAITKPDLPPPHEYLSGRAFVIRHMGYTRTCGYNMGWALFPGMGVGDDWLDVWMPLPAPPTQKGGA